MACAQGTEPSFSSEKGSFVYRAVIHFLVSFWFQQMTRMGSADVFTLKASID